MEKVVRIPHFIQNKSIPVGQFLIKISNADFAGAFPSPVVFPLFSAVALFSFSNYCLLQPVLTADGAVGTAQDLLESKELEF